MLKQQFFKFIYKIIVLYIHLCHSNNKYISYKYLFFNFKLLFFNEFEKYILLI